LIAIVTPHNTYITAGASGVEAVVQNVKTLLGTRIGTVPLDREFGIDHNIIDRPIHLQQELLRQEIFAKIRRYEPRAIITEIDFDYIPMEGEIAPKVMIEVELNGTT